MKIIVKVQAVLAGDTLEGKASAGMFGSFSHDGNAQDLMVANTV
jgi:hypothetical protein